MASRAAPAAPGRRGDAAHREYAAAWRASAAARSRTRGPTVRRSSASSPSAERDPTFPVPLRARSAAAGRRCSSSGDLRRPRSPPRRHRRHAQRHPGQVATPPSTLGRELAEAGVVVVSGLAKGIDGAAHRGALRSAGGSRRRRRRQRARPSVPAPARRAVGRRSASDGLLLSEWPPGTAPEPFRFPMRNRILAALSEVLVVVESRERGGSLITAQAALERSIEVMAVPGSVQNRAAAGTNHLLRDGAAPVTGVDDVLVALGLDTGGPGDSGSTRDRCPRGIEAAVLAAVAPRRPRSTTSWRAWALASPTRRWRSPASSARDGCATPADGSNRWCHGRPLTEYPRPRCTDDGSAVACREGAPMPIPSAW